MNHLTLFNPRRAYAARVTVLGPFVCLSVCLSVTTFSATMYNKRTIPKGSVLHWLYFKFGEFRKSTVFQTYGVKTE